MADRTRSSQSSDTDAGGYSAPTVARLVTAWLACTLAETAGTVAAQAVTDGSPQRSCELLRDIVHLLSATGPLLESAVVSEHLSGANWEEIATTLRLPPEATRARYAPAVDRFRHHRSHPEADLADSSTHEERWNAFPVFHPHEAARDLDEWLRRHGEITGTAQQS
ncbi:hypothetical protein AB0942_34920 [Streptomyces nodosus]|uniref:hypothetical protein n=1 Tax=Streptomyces nodosus TaxID=40318 RepID=UPI0034562DC0